jgi:hypothetical protein
MVLSYRQYNNVKLTGPGPGIPSVYVYNGA